MTTPRSYYYPQPDVRPLPTTRVLEGRPLRAGTDLASTARFADDVWDLAPVMLQAQQTGLVLDFRKVPDRFRHAAKVLCLELLAGRLRTGAQPSRAPTIRSKFTKIRHFLNWLDSQGIPALGAVTAEDLRSYARKVRSQGNCAGHDRSYISACGLLWVAGPALGEDSLRHDPGAVVEADPRLARRKRSAGPENGTDRIPEAVLGPLLQWAFRWTEDFAGDVIRAYDRYQVLFANSIPQRQASGRRSPLYGQVDSLLQEVLDTYRRQGRPLPAVRGKGPKHRHGEVNITHLMRQVGCGHGSLTTPARLAMIDAAVAELGLSDGALLEVGPLAELDGKPWLDQLAYEDVDQLIRLLQTACYIVIAYLSGMRDPEVKHMRPGCLTYWRDEDGTILRQKVTSLAFKDEDDPAGVEATWIVGAPVARAIKILERLLPEGKDYLFSVRTTSTHARRATQMGRAKSTGRTRDDLRDFMTWINEFCAARGRSDSIPTVNGSVYNITTRQFRRTLAWFIARRPGGTIAGAIQYRHHSIQMFEGYAGTSASGFRAEVEAEQAIARGEKLGDLILHGEHHRLTGPAAAEAEARLVEFERHADFLGKTVPDPRREARIMARHDPKIYPGTFVTCVDNPDRRACEKGKDSSLPDLPGCKPYLCRNVALTAQNTQTFIAHTIELRQARELAAPLVAQRLTKRLDEAEAFLTANGVTIPEDRP